MVSRYSDNQKDLLKRVSELRLGRGLPFLKIAKTLMAAKELRIGIIKLRQ